MQSNLKKALIVEGGAMRGVFSTGVLDEFLQQDFNPFDIYYGVSAGAANLAAYLANMPGRNLKIYTDYALRPEFISLRKYLKGGHLMDLDWLWDVTIKELRLDLKKIYQTGKPFIVCLTEVLSGQAEYRKTSAKDLEHLLKVSSALPILYRNFPRVDGRPMADGGLADAIPVAEAIRLGATEIMVLRSRPYSYSKSESHLQALFNWRLKDYPLLQKLMAGRAKRYNDALALIRQPPDGVSITEICPPESFRPSRLGKNVEILMQGYQQGRAEGNEAIKDWLGNQVPGPSTSKGQQKPLQS